MDSLTAHETNESANHLYKEKVSQLDICLDISNFCLDVETHIKLLYFGRIIKLMKLALSNLYMYMI